jgi:hypothetical protein
LILPTRPDTYLDGWHFDEMFQTQCERGRGCLHLVWSGALRQLRPAANRTTHCVFRRMCFSAGAKRDGCSVASGQERAKRKGQCILLLLVRRTVGWSGGRSLVHVAVAISHLLHGGLCCGVDPLRHLVSTRRKEAGFWFVTAGLNRGQTHVDSFSFAVIRGWV